MIGTITQPKLKLEISFAVVIKLDIGHDNFVLNFLHIPNNIHVNIVPARIIV
jgi:hypothetical protein